MSDTVREALQEAARRNAAIAAAFEVPEWYRDLMAMGED